MARASIRIWFALAVAAIAAAIADPLVERASNAGLFGSGTFTDRSTLDVLPALAIGGFFLATHLVLRVRRVLSGAPEPNLARASCEALGASVTRLLPAIFGLQLVVLFCMETGEQLAVYGRVLGGTVWLGGPILISLSAHAVACVTIALLLAALLQFFAGTAVCAIRLIRAMATRPAHVAPPVYLPFFDDIGSIARAFVRCGVGERAPPLLTA